MDIYNEDIAAICKDLFGDDFKVSDYYSIQDVGNNVIMYFQKSDSMEDFHKIYNPVFNEQYERQAKNQRNRIIEKISKLSEAEAEKFGREKFGPNWKKHLGLEINSDPDPQADAAPITSPQIPQNSTLKYKKADIQDMPPASEELIGQPRDPSLRYDIKTRLRLRSLYEGDYSKREFIKPGFPVGVVGSLVAPGGSSKTYKALQDALLLATTEEYRKPCGVLYLPAEDSIDEIGLRIQAIIKAYGLTDKEIDLGNENFQIWSLLAESPDLLEKKGNSSPLVDAICEIAKSYRRDPLKLVIFDTLRRFSYADENDGGAMSRLLSVMELICKRCGCSCLFLHHTTKSAALANLIDVQQASRGSSVLVDNLRYQEFLRVMTAEEANEKGEIFIKTNEKGEFIKKTLPTVAIGENNRKQYVCWGVSKQNYGELVEDQWYRRNESGVLLKVELAKVKEKKEEKRGRGGEL